MTDQELLTYAAKAAGISKDRINPLRPSTNIGLDDYKKPWNPLENDADAFQLMVKLNIEIEFSDCEVAATFYNKKRIDDRFLIEFFTSEDEKLKASKRIVTRAAAEIGKGM